MTNVINLSDYYRDSTGKVRQTWKKHWTFKPGVLTYKLQMLDDYGQPVPNKVPGEVHTTRRTLLSTFYEQNPAIKKTSLTKITEWYNKQGLYFRPL